MSDSTQTSASSNSAANVPIDPSKFKKENIRIEPCQWNTIGNSSQRYGRAKLKYVITGADGRQTTQDLVLRGPPMNTYGVGDNRDEKSKEVTGHSVCFNLPKGGSPFEKAVMDIHRACCENIAQYAESFGLDSDKFKSWEAVDMILDCPAKHPKNKDTKRTDTSKPKRLYCKLIEYKGTETKPAKMVTVFDDGASFNPLTRRMERQLDPLTVRSSVEMIPSILFDSIYFGSKPSLQVKLPRAAITRTMEQNTVAAADEDVGAYMMSLGISNVNSSDSSSHSTADPATLL